MDHVDIKTLIDASLKKIHHVTDVAEITGISFESLRKDFRRREGVSLAKYIRITRVEKMKELVFKSDDSFINISLNVGFSREDIACRVFKQVTGMTMTEFRKHGADHEPGSDQFTSEGNTKIIYQNSQVNSTAKA